MSMQAVLRAKFFDQFTSTAHKRLAASQKAVSDDGAEEAASELHCLAGEASMLGFEEIATMARAAENEAKSWLEGSSASRVKCGRSLRLIGRALEALVQEAQSEQAPPSTSVPLERQSSGVLIVDDSELVTGHVQDALEERQVVVGVAHDLAGAVAQAERQTPAVILVDANIPGVNSQELVTNLRRVSATSSILIISGLSDEELDQLAQDLAADGYISKRDGIDEVVTGVMRALVGTVA